VTQIEIATVTATAIANLKQTGTETAIAIATAKRTGTQTVTVTESAI
jgi:hypothetical protein